MSEQTIIEQELERMLSQEELDEATWERLKPKIVDYFDQVVKDLIREATTATSGTPHANIQPILDFNPAEHLMQIGFGQNKQDYLQVQWRLAWFRALCPHGKVLTEIAHLDLDRPVEAWKDKWVDDPTRPGKKKAQKEKVLGQGIAIFKAVVEDGQGGIGTGHGMENAAAFDAYMEKAETAAIGRALAALGYGTQFTGSEFKSRIVDAPVDTPDEGAAPTTTDATNNRRSSAGSSGGTQQRSSNKASTSTGQRSASAATAQAQPKDFSLDDLKASAERSVQGGWKKVCEVLAEENETLRTVFFNNNRTIRDELFDAPLRQSAARVIRKLASTANTKEPAHV